MYGVRSTEYVNRCYGAGAVATYLGTMYFLGLKILLPTRVLRSSLLDKPLEKYEDTSRLDRRENKG